MGEDNLSAVLLKPGDLQLKQAPLPEDPLKNEVLLRTLSVGICGSDVHYWKTGRIGDFVVNAPMILGHETSAVVVKVGPNVNHLKVGDRVAIEPGVPCKSCDFCKNGTYNLCPEITFHATPPYDGTLTRFFKHAADFCFKLPDNVSADEGALLEPLSVGVHACRRADIKPGQKVLITGAGCIGLVSIISASAFGASKIFVTDINEERLKVALKMGATGTYCVQRSDTPEIVAQKIIQELGGPPEVTIECSGAESSVNTAILSTRPSGVVVIVGMGCQTVTIPLVTAGVREIDIRGVFRYKNTYPLCLSLIAEGKINLKQLVTHRYKLEQSLDAFEAAKQGQGIKIIIDCDRNAA